MTNTLQNLGSMITKNKSKLLTFFLIMILTISGCTSKPLSSQYNKGIELLFYDDLKNEKRISIPIQLDTIKDEVYLFNKDELVYTLTPSTYRYDDKAEKITLTLNSYIEHFNRIKIGAQYYDLDDYYLEKMSDVNMRRDLKIASSVTLDGFNSEVRDRSSDEYYVISEDADYDYMIVFPFSEFSYLTSDLTVTTNETGKEIHHHFELDDSFLKERGIKSITFEAALVKQSLDSDELEVITMIYQPFILE